MAKAKKLKDFFNESEDMELFVGGRALKEVKQVIKERYVISKIPVLKDAIGYAVLEVYNNTDISYRLFIKGGWIYVINISSPIGRAYGMARETNLLEIWKTFVKRANESKKEEYTVSDLFIKEDGDIVNACLFFNVASKDRVKFIDKKNGLYDIVIKSASTIVSNPALEDETIPYIDSITRDFIEKGHGRLKEFDLTIEDAKKIVYNINLIKGMYAYISHNAISVLKA